MEKPIFKCLHLTSLLQPHVGILSHYIAKVPTFKGCCLCQVRVFLYKNETVVVNLSTRHTDSVISILSLWIYRFLLYCGMILNV